MSQKKKLKLQYLERGVNAINLLTGNTAELYYCPICAQSFPRRALDEEQLTLEHFPPKAQGGNGIALTCSRCNNKAGHTVDAAVSNRSKVLSIEPLYSKNGQYKGRIVLDFGDTKLGSINFDLSIQDSKVNFFLLKDLNHPDASDRIKDYFRKLNKIPDEDRSPIRITTRQRFHGWYSKVGDLRTAFLVCFAFFGYSYAFDRRLEPVRNQIINYDKKIIDGFWLISKVGDEADTNLYIIDEPFSAISVHLGKIFVLIPWFDSVEPFYDFLIHQYPENGHMNFKGERLAWPKRQEMNFDFFKVSNTTKPST